jgi:predicted MFS family arabinose efflux permease
LIHRKKPLFFTSIILAGILCYSILHNLPVYSENPFNRFMNFKQPVFATSDAASNIYLIDDGTKRIMKLDAAGKVIFVLNGETGGSPGFFSAQELAVDSYGNLYVLDNLLDENGQNVEKEEIIRYTANGKFKDIVYSVEYAEEDRPIRTGNICSISVYKENLYLYNKKKDSFVLTRVALDTKKSKDIIHVAFADAASMIVDFGTAYDPPASIFTTKRGEIYKAVETGDLSLVYTGDNKAADFVSSIPWKAEVYDRDTVYFSDILQRSIRCIEPSGNVRTLISDKILQEQGYDSDGVNFYTVSVAANGNAVLVSNGNVVSCNNMSIVGFYGSRGLLPVSGYLLRLLQWIQIVLLAGILAFIAWYLVVNIFKGRPSAVLMQSLFVIFAIVIATLLVSNTIFDKFQSRYESDIFNHISQTMFLASKNIDGDTFEKIKKPEHFMDENYKLIREQLHASFNYNQDTWNEGFYGALYTVVDNKLYAVMYYDDSKCPFYPLAEDGSEQDYLRVFNEKIMITTKSSDAEGDWMYGMTPVLNSSGKVVGVLEVGTDSYGFNQENSRLKNEVLLKTATLLVVLIFIMLEITIFADLLRKRRERLPDEADSKMITSLDTLTMRPLCFLIYLACFMSGSFVPILMKQLYRPILGLPENVVLALPISVEALLIAVSSVIGGYVNDKKGCRPTLISGLVLLFGGQLISGFAGSPAMFIFARAVAGAGMGLTFISMQNYVVIPASEEERNEGISALNSGGFAGLNAGLIVGGLLAEKFGMSKVYFFSTALVMICVFLSIKTVKNNTCTVQKEGNSQGSIKSLFKFFTTPAVSTFFLLMLIPTVICTMFIDYFFPLFAEGQKMSTSGISRAFLLYGLSIIYLGPSLTVYISKKIGAKLSMLLAALILAAALLQFAVQGTLTSAFIAIFMIGISESFGITLRVNYFSSINAADLLGQGKSLGYYGLVENLGQVLGPIIYGMVIGMGIFKGIGLIGIFFIGVISLFSILSVRKKAAVANALKV